MIKKGKYAIHRCRVCKSKRLYFFLSLGEMPIPNGFLSKKELKKKEPKYPLAVCVCEDCHLVQLTHTIPSEIMFKNYLYIPSTSTTMQKHFHSMAQTLTKQQDLQSGDLVVDIGSNDGTLLGYFRELEMNVLGVDPAENLAKVATMKGIETLPLNFTDVLAKKIVKKKGNAKVITATNVFAHIDDVHSVCAGVKSLLAPEGIFVIEFPYLLDLLEKNEFDTIYHEHLSYFAIYPLTVLFATHALRIVDIHRIPVHGGSLRIIVKHATKNQQVAPIVEELLHEERLRKMNTKIPYDDFARRVKTIRRDLVAYLKRLKKGGKQIVGYGASAKGNVLMNYCGITLDILDFIVDSIPYKQGRYTPGTHIPIYSEQKLTKEKPDYALLLAWNFADEILRKQNAYRENGGQFIITIPFLRIE